MRPAPLPGTVVDYTDVETESKGHFDSNRPHLPTQNSLKMRPRMSSVET
jgi:hypothetical protein